MKQITFLERIEATILSTNWYNDYNNIALSEIKSYLN